MQCTVRSGVVLFALSIATAAAGQADGPVRDRLRGVVRDLADKPWAGATVVFHGRPLPGIEAAGKADRVEIRSDARGRFAALLLRGRQYLAYAFAAGGRDATHRVTRARSGVMAGRPIVLRESARRVIAPHVELKGIEPWLEHGPLRLVVTSRPGTVAFPVSYPACRAAVEFVLDAGTLDGATAQLPVLPWPECTVEVYDGRGVRLAVAAVPLDAAVRKSGAVATPAATVNLLLVAYGIAPPAELVSKTVSRVTVAKPKSSEVMVTDKAGGKPAKAATLWQNVRGSLARVGTAGANGRIAFVLPASVALPRGLFVGGPGLAVTHATQPSANSFVVFGRAQAKKPKKDAKLRVVLDKEIVLRGRLMLDATQPLPHTRLLIIPTTQGVAIAFLARANDRIRVAETDADGRFELPGAAPGEYSVWAVLPQNATAALRGRRRSTPHSLALVRRRKITTPKEADLGDVVVAKLQRFELHVRAPDGSPVPRARLAFYRPVNNFPIRDRLLGFTDRLGSFVFLADRLTGCSCLAVGAMGFKLIRFDTLDPKADLADVELDVQLDVQLEEPRRVAGVVKDPRGRPLAGVLVQAHAGGVIDVRDDAYVALLGLPERSRCKTDARGRFDVWSIGPRGLVNLTVSDWKGGALFSQSRQVDVRDSSVLDYEFEWSGQRKR